MRKLKEIRALVEQEIKQFELDHPEEVVDTEYQLEIGRYEVAQEILEILNGEIE